MKNLESIIMENNLHEEIFEQAISILRVKYYREDNAVAIPREDMNWTYYKLIVEECAKTVEHIKVWDGNLGDHIRNKMGTL